MTILKEDQKGLIFQKSGHQNLAILAKGGVPVHK